ncbi:unnamed protein product, partial [Mesorhabditis belari]|uniref:EGF-like domain-containing protein n=1 Tax=Mesorhabditis belari TaxID=2138241 RepID=A0AAF3E8W2_9BILA
MYIQSWVLAALCVIVRTVDSDSTTHSTTTTTTSSTTKIPPVVHCVSGPGNKCFFIGTNDECDPCANDPCGPDLRCSLKQNSCQPQCFCKKRTQHFIFGSCMSICTPNPCNDQKCQETETLSEGYRCICDADWDGKFCEKWKNYCLEPKPTNCPKGPHDCQMKAPGDYECECTTGFFHNQANNSCDKIGQLLEVKLKFTGVYYHELLNNISSPYFQNTTLEINETLSDIFGDDLLGLAYNNFTEGSLIANFNVSLKVQGFPEDNVNRFERYIVDCRSRDWKENGSRLCFRSLGVPFILFDGIHSNDLRCSGIFCPPRTRCIPLDNESQRVSCVCERGYRSIGTTSDQYGDVIEKCQDIDECTSNEGSPCPFDEVCKNHDGGYNCISTPCAKNPCPGNAVCVSDSVGFYKCECSWIYSASGCTSAWPLVVLIVAIFLLISTTVLIISLILCCVPELEDETAQADNLRGGELASALSSSSLENAINRSNGGSPSSPSSSAEVNLAPADPRSTEPSRNPRGRSPLLKHVNKAKTTMGDEGVREERNQLARQDASVSAMIRRSPLGSRPTSALRSSLLQLHELKEESS